MFLMFIPIQPSENVALTIVFSKSTYNGLNKITEDKSLYAVSTLFTVIQFISVWTL